MNIVGTARGGETDAFFVTEDRVLFGPESIVRGVTDPILAGKGVAVNNAGQFALFGAEHAPGMNGFFPDARSFIFASDEVVIAEGDVFDDKIIRFVYPNFDINDHGDVAFRVVFEDFSQAVIVATPIPEPSSITLAGFTLFVALALLPRRPNNLTCPIQIPRCQGDPS